MFSDGGKIMAIKNILVPHDGSEPATKAFKKAVQIAKQHDSKITILTCLDLAGIGGWYVDNRINKQIMRKAKNETKKLVSELESFAKKSSISVNSVIKETHVPVNTIVSFSKSKGVDVIVMGSSGRGKFDKFMLGSVSNGVLQKAKCPVLIIK